MKNTRSVSCLCRVVLSASCDQSGVRGTAHGQQSCVMGRVGTGLGTADVGYRVQFWEIQRGCRCSHSGRFRTPRLRTAKRFGFAGSTRRAAQGKSLGPLTFHQHLDQAIGEPSQYPCRERKIPKRDQQRQARRAENGLSALRQPTGDL